MFLWETGRPLLRVEVQAVLEKAGEASGVDPLSIGSHSLRFGGASALYAAFKDTALIQRWGRWNNDAFQGYFWEARDMAQGAASSVAAADLTTV